MMQMAQAGSGWAFLVGATTRETSFSDVFDRSAFTERLVEDRQKLHVKREPI